MMFGSETECSKFNLYKDRGRWAPALYKGEYSYDTMGTTEVGVVSQLKEHNTSSTAGP